jgi:hypothetical protein
MTRSAHDPLRRRLAYEAARILAESGDQEFARARRKAAERLGVRDRRLLPDNGEIQAALLEQQQLFRGAEQEDVLRRLRQAALEAMAVFARFEPRLAGPVLEGSADRNAAVQLHLFADAVEQLAFQLLDRHIPWRQGEREYRFGDGTSRVYPALSFHAGDTPFELTCFPLSGLREAPLSPIDNRPQRRATAAQVRALIQEDV